MPETQKIKITDSAHAATISEWAGLARAETTLDQSKLGSLPGFALAVALVSKEAADARAQAMTANLKAVARAGHDICQTKSISLDFEKGVPVLIVEMMDLADMAGPENA